MIMVIVISIISVVVIIVDILSESGPEEQSLRLPPKMTLKKLETKLSLEPIEPAK
jgi:hypothetical protein